MRPWLSPTRWLVALYGSSLLGCGFGGTTATSTATNRDVVEVGAAGEPTGPKSALPRYTNADCSTLMDVALPLPGGTIALCLPVKVGVGHVFPDIDLTQRSASCGPDCVGPGPAADELDKRLGPLREDYIRHFEAAGWVQVAPQDPSNPRLIHARHPGLNVVITAFRDDSGALNVTVSVKS